MKTYQNDNDALTLEVFHTQKILTLSELIPLLKRSVRTVHSRLKKWNVISSYNMNSRYYSLPTIAKFDENGLWHYKGIHFSKHGSLKQTIIHIIKKSESGLRAQDIGEILKMDTRSFLSHFKAMPEIIREKIDGRYLYFSSDVEVYKKQKSKRIKDRETRLLNPLKDSTAIFVLIELIKFPELDLRALSRELRKKGVRVKPERIADFLRFHCIEKKTMDLR